MRKLNSEFLNSESMLLNYFHILTKKLPKQLATSQPLPRLRLGDGLFGRDAIYCVRIGRSKLRPSHVEIRLAVAVLAQVDRQRARIHPVYAGNTLFLKEGSP